MRFDLQSMFFDGAALSGTSVSSEAIDAGKAGFAEVQAYVVARFDTELHGAKKVELMGSTDNLTYHPIASTVVLDETAGAGVTIPLPQGCPQYLKLTVTGVAMMGAVTAGITLQAPSPRGKRIGDYAAN